MTNKVSSGCPPYSSNGYSMHEWKFPIGLLLLSFLVNADEAVRGTDAGFICPMRQTRVSIIKELVSIKLFRDSARVHCSFWMKADSADELLTVGFPNCYRPETDRSDCIGAFHCLIDSLPSACIEMKDSTIMVGKKKYNSWFQWQTPFRKGTIHRIDCSYVGKFSGGSYGYLIGTGNTWNGPIGEGRIVFDHSAVCSKRFVQDPSLSRTNIYINGMAYEDSVVYSFYNYRPSSSEFLSISIFPFWNNSTAFTVMDTTCMFGNIQSMKMSFPHSFIFELLADSVTYRHLIDLHAIKNELLARNGYPFPDNAFLRAFFAAKAWYKPNENFHLSQVSSHEQIAIRICSSNPDSLRRAIGYAHGHRYKVTLTDATIWPMCIRSGVKATIREGIEKILQAGEDFLQPVFPEYRENCTGAVTIYCKITAKGSTDNVRHTTTIKDTAVVNQLLAHVGLVKNGSLVGLSNCVCSFLTKFGFTIAIEEKISDDGYLRYE